MGAVVEGRSIRRPPQQRKAEVLLDQGGNSDGAEKWSALGSP